MKFATWDNGRIVTAGTSGNAGCMPCSDVTVLDLVRAGRPLRWRPAQPRWRRRRCLSPGSVCCRR